MNALYVRAKFFCLCIDVYIPQANDYGHPKTFQNGTFALLQEGEHGIRTYTTDRGQQIDWFVGPKLVYFEKGGIGDSVTFYRHKIITAMNLPNNRGIFEGQNTDVVYVSDFSDLLRTPSIAILDGITGCYLNEKIVRNDPAHYKVANGGIYIRKVGNVALSIERMVLDNNEYGTGIMGLEYIPPYRVNYLAEDVNKVVYRCGAACNRILPNVRGGYQLETNSSYIRVEYGQTFGRSAIEFSLGNGIVFTAQMELAVGTSRVGDGELTNAQLQKLANLAQHPNTLNNFIKVDCVGFIKESMMRDKSVQEFLDRCSVELNTLFHYHTEAINNEMLIVASTIMAQMNNWYRATKAALANSIERFINNCGDTLFSYSVVGNVNVESKDFVEIISSYETHYNRVLSIAMTPENQVAIINALKGTTPAAIDKIMGAVQKIGNDNFVNQTQNNMTQVIKNAITTTDNNKGNLSNNLHMALRGRRILDNKTRQSVTADKLVDMFVMICNKRGIEAEQGAFEKWLTDQDMFMVN